MAGAKQTVLTIVTLLVFASGLQAQSQIPWLTDVREAGMLAERQQRLVLLHFWSESCPPCVKLERTVFNRPEVIRAMISNYVPVKVNVDQDGQLAQYYRVQQWPTDIILKADGTEIYRATSPQDPNRYIATLDQIASHTRIGLPISGSPTTEVATAPGGSNTPYDHGSFPGAPTAYGMSSALQSGSNSSYSGSDYGGGSYAPQASPGSPSAANAGFGSPAYGTPAQQPAQQPASGPSQYGASQYGASPQGPGQYVANQYGASQYGAEQRGASQYGGGQAIANQFATGDAAQPSRDQQASFNAERGGQFQLPGATGGNQSPSGSVQPNPYMPAAGPTAPGGAAASVAMNQPPVRRESAVAGQMPVEPAVQGQPTLGLEGYCCVTLAEKERWVKGDPQWGAIHRGRTYLFAGPEEQQRFMADFDRYAPALSGYDCVKYAEHGTLVEGKRAHGIFYRGQIFLFADEAALEQFWKAPDRYLPLVQAEQDRQAARR